MKRTLLIMAAIIILFSLTASRFFSPRHVDATGGHCYPLDVIFVIDQAEQMSDPLYPTDPGNERKYAVDAMIDWLSAYPLDTCPNSQNRVGVISFGTDYRIDLPLRPLAPANYEELKALEKDLAVFTKADNLGHSNPLLAFQQIQGMFNDTEIPTSGPRKRVVILLTHGLIDYGDPGKNNNGEGYKYATLKLQKYITDNFPFDPTLLKREQCIDFMVESYQTLEKIPTDRMNECLKNNEVMDTAYSNSTYIYIILMNYGQEWPDVVKDYYKQVAQDHAGEVMDFYEKHQENRQTIPTYFQTVLSRLMGMPAGQVSCGGIAVNPYLDKAVFHFYKYSPDTVVTISYTGNDGKQYKIYADKQGLHADTGGFDVVDHQPDYSQNDSSGSPNEIYIFNKPYPGIWHIQSDACTTNNINAFYQEVQINPGGYHLSLPILAKFDLKPYYDVSNRVYLEYQMHDEEGKVVDNSDQYLFNIEVQATVTHAGGGPKTYNLFWVPGDHLFQAKDPLELPVAGKYQVTFTGRTKYHEGDLSVGALTDISKVFTTDKFVFTTSDISMDVRDSKPFVIASVSPTKDQTLPQIHSTILGGWPLAVAPIPVSIKLNSRDNQPLAVTADQVLADPANSVTAWVANNRGEESKHIVLHPDIKVANQFTGTIPWNGTEPQLILHVQITGSLKNDYQADQSEIQIPFSRLDSSPIYKAEFYILLLIVLIIAIVIFLISFIWNHTNQVGGTMLFQKNGVVLDRWDCYSGRRTSVYKVKDKDDSLIKDLIVLKVRFARQSADDDGGANASRKVHVYGKTNCGKKIDLVMQSGDNTAYCDDHTENSINYLAPGTEKAI